jgi:hypothetical protein
MLLSLHLRHMGFLGSSALLLIAPLPALQAWRQVRPGGEGNGEEGRGVTERRIAARCGSGGGFGNTAGTELK